MQLRAARSAGSFTGMVRVGSSPPPEPEFGDENIHISLCGGIGADGSVGHSQMGARIDHDGGRLPVERGVAAAPWEVDAHDAVRRSGELRDEDCKAMVAV